MNILITGSASGIGQALHKQLSVNHKVFAPTRDELDLSDTQQILNYQLASYDMLINCAATGRGGKIDFVDHQSQAVIEIINTNLVAPMLLSKRVLSNDPGCKIINITSTNNNRYYGNDLVYSLTKKSLADFGTMLKIDYPMLRYLEVKLGLTRTKFNQSRYRDEPDRFIDIYQQHLCLEPDAVADRIVSVLFDDTIKILEISP
jgi:short-subunit dehydrogenase